MWVSGTDPVDNGFELSDSLTWEGVLVNRRGATSEVLDCAKTSVVDVFFEVLDSPKSSEVLNTYARKRIELRTFGRGDVVHKYVDRKYRWCHQNIGVPPFAGN